MALDWDKLRIFHAVASAGSFTHAASTLGISQSAISRQISGLEDQLGIILFHRHARGLVMTEQGEMLFTTTDEIFGRLALIEGQLVDTKDKAEGPLSITASEFIGTHWLSPLIPRFQKQYPDIHLTLTLDDRVLNLGMREADIALRHFEPNQPDLIQRHIAHIPCGLFAADTYLAVAGTPQTAHDLTRHNLIIFPDQNMAPYNDPNWVLGHLESGHGNMRTTEVNSVSAMNAWTRMGGGIAALPHFMADGLTPVLPDLEKKTIDLYFVYPEVRRHSRRIEIFRDFLLSEIQGGRI